MFVAISALLAVAVVALVVVLVRTRRDRDAARAAEAERGEQVRRSRDEAADAERRSAESARQRDEALERVQRARRDAVDVANRLNALTAEHESLTTAHEAVAAEHESLVVEHRTLTAAHDALVRSHGDLEVEHRELADSLTQIVAEHRAQMSTSAAGDGEVLMSRTVATDPAPGTVLDGELVWGLTLARLDRLWRVSVMAGPSATSPLMTSDDLLADALGIVVAAAREEAGALVELDVRGGGDVDGSTAAVVVGLAEELISAAVSRADESTLVVEVDAECVTVSLDATADGETVVVPGPQALRDSSGRYRVPRRPVTGGGSGRSASG